VYRLGDHAIISTVDFFPPVVDDPYHFGAIAAANALSDIYAMGGDVLFAINLVAFPGDLDLSILTDILRGGADQVAKAGAVIAGGHSITDKEPKYGLAVTGRIDPDKIIAKGGALPGDVLILTKPLGIGVITTAHKRGVVDPAHLQTAITSMTTLNRAAAQAAQAVGFVHAMTDITGYSLIGHAHEMAHLSNADFTFDYAAIPFLPGSEGYAQQSIFPGGASNNRLHFEQWTDFSPELSADENEWRRMLLYDPETSGGLLMSVAAEKSDTLMAELASRGVTGTVIGRVESGSGRIHIR
jgi:selenide, water dikinase